MDAHSCSINCSAASRVTRHDAAHIHDHLDAAIRPTVVLMNPPFSVAAHVDGRVADAALRHISSALARLADGGRLVAITGANLSPDNPTWRDGFRPAAGTRPRGVFRADRRARLCPSWHHHRDASDGHRPCAGRRSGRHSRPRRARHPTPRVLLDWVMALVPPRPAVTTAAAVTRYEAADCSANTFRAAHSPFPDASIPRRSLTRRLRALYETVDWAPQSGGRHHRCAL